MYGNVSYHNSMVMSIYHDSTMMSIYHNSTVMSIHHNATVMAVDVMMLYQGVTKHT